MQPRAARCLVHEILEIRYRVNLRAYREAIHQLDLCQVEEFDRVYEEAERKRVALEDAKAALKTHGFTHGCG